MKILRLKEIKKTKPQNPPSIKQLVSRSKLLGMKVMTNPDSVLKSRAITLLTKARIVRAMVFLVVMKGCESWITKKAECQRIDAFKLWY